MPGGMAHRDGEQRSHGQWEEPPPVRAVMGGDEHDGDGDDDAEGEPPVVADDEVVPEADP